MASSMHKNQGHIRLRSTTVWPFYCNTMYNQSSNFKSWLCGPKLLANVLMIFCVILLEETKTKEPTEEVKQELKRVKKSTSRKNEESKILFKFEYEGDNGEVRSILVKEVRWCR